MLELWGPDGIGEIDSRTDLVALLIASIPLQDGDIVAVTSKVVSKAEGRLIAVSNPNQRDAALEEQTVREVARRGPVRIVENRLGLVMAGAGIDASNLAQGWLALLPENPDASAREIRERLVAHSGVNVGVLITDTSGRPWRVGQTDIAIGVAGLKPIESYEGRKDSYGNRLTVTAPAIADEIAGAAELVSGKLGARPFVRIRGLSNAVLPAGDAGPGARTLLRPAVEDLFALGTREAIVAVIAGEQAASGPATPEDLCRALDACTLTHRRNGNGIVIHVDTEEDRWRANILLSVHEWHGEHTSGEIRARPCLD